MLTQGRTMRALVACLISFGVIAVPAQARMTGAERQVVKRINEMRVSHGLARVHSDGKLARAASAHGRDMLRRNFFSHTSSNGTSSSDRIRRYRRSRYVGETLAYAPKGSRTSARAVVRLWMNSASHYDVLTTRRFRRIGVDKRRGRLDGRNVTVWTVDLSSRR